MESSTFTYDMVKSLKATGVKPTVEQLTAAIADSKAKIVAAATEYGKLALLEGEAGGKLHANVKCSPFPVEEDKAALDKLKKDGHDAIAKAEEEIRHLSKLTSWLLRINSGLSMES